MKRFFLFATLLVLPLAALAQPYWNQKLKILPLRAPVGERPEFMDLNGDGRQDAVKSYIKDDVPILWLDEDGNMKEGDTYEHTIEKSELYKGQKVTYYAPFTKCDRIEDYRTAWVHFEKQFN